MDDKWLAHLDAAVQGEMDRVSQALAGRIKTWPSAMPCRCRSLSMKWPSSAPA